MQESSYIQFKNLFTDSSMLHELGDSLQPGGWMYLRLNATV